MSGSLVCGITNELQSKKEKKDVTSTAQPKSFYQISFFIPKLLKLKTLNNISQTRKCVKSV